MFKIIIYYYILLQVICIIYLKMSTGLDVAPGKFVSVMNEIFNIIICTVVFRELKRILAPFLWSKNYLNLKKIQKWFIFIFINCILPIKIRKYFWQLNIISLIVFLCFQNPFQFHDLVIMLMPQSLLCTFLSPYYFWYNLCIIPIS